MNAGLKWPWTAEKPPRPPMPIMPIPTRKRTQKARVNMHVHDKNRAQAAIPMPPIMPPPRPPNPPPPPAIIPPPRGPWGIMPPPRPPANPPPPMLFPNPVPIPKLPMPKLPITLGIPPRMPPPTMPPRMGLLTMLFMPIPPPPPIPPRKLPPPRPTLPWRLFWCRCSRGGGSVGRRPVLPLLFGLGRVRRRLRWKKHAPLGSVRKGLPLAELV
ncbi:hypothetical protein C8Q74DRAFT_642538 [Fomes fomentarius]|nr:hypothetical protein C8Q74DRAFT_642538 [Fomes fomentarius]